MKNLTEYINEHINEAGEATVYAVVDMNDEIQSVFDDEATAKEFAKTLPAVAEPKVKSMKRSEIEK